MLIEKRKTITLFLTHSCNLNCTYCYEHYKSSKKMSFEMAKQIIDREFCDLGDYNYVEINLFGGEPFLEFPLIRQIVEYVEQCHFNVDHIVFITTNGTLVHGEIQDWLKEHTKTLQCSLSLDGTREMHNINRSNSFDLIDYEFFKRTYPAQTVKMTISNDSLNSLAECVIFAHDLGFKVSCNLAYEIDWSDEKNESILSRELQKLCNYYLNNPDVKICSLLDRSIESIGYQKPEDVCFSSKWCGTGTDMPTYDVDGEKYGCQFFAPLTLGKERAKELQSYVMNREIDINLLDEKCRNCVIEELCPTCYGSNYATSGSLYHKDDNMCRLTKIVMKFAAVLKAQRWQAGLLIDEYSGDKEQALLRAILKINEMKL